MSVYFDHWGEAGIFKDSWHRLWPNFTPRELASKGDGSLKIDVDALNRLQHARNILGGPIIVNAAYRDPKHNASVGGASKSLHLEGRAFDIAIEDSNKNKLIAIFKEVGFTGFGVNYTTHIHIDTGKERTW